MGESCLNCSARYTACHDSCSTYVKFRKKQDEINKKYRQYMDGRGYDGCHHRKVGGLKGMNKQGLDIEIARAIENVKRTIMNLQNIEDKGYVEKIKLKALEKYQNYIQYEIFKSILQERQRQDDKLGEQNHPLGLWTGILGEEYGELCEAINETVFDNGTCKGGYENMKREAIHVAAVAVGFLEFLERDNNRGT